MGGMSISGLRDPVGGLLWWVLRVGPALPTALVLKQPGGGDPWVGVEKGLPLAARLCWNLPNPSERLETGRIFGVGPASALECWSEG